MKLPIPEMPWYKAINKKLEGSEWLVSALLVTIVVLIIILLIRGDRVAKTAFLVYLISP